MVGEKIDCFEDVEDYVGEEEFVWSVIDVVFEEEEVVYVYDYYFLEEY